MTSTSIPHINEQIQELRTLGVLFDDTERVNIVRFLSENTYYEKLRTYLGNNPDHLEQPRITFAELVELSRIDFRLSRQVLTLSLSIEHALKLRIIPLILNSQELLLSKCLDKIDDEQRQKAAGKKTRSRLPSEQLIKTTPYSKSYLNNNSDNDDSGRQKTVRECSLWELFETQSFWFILELYKASCSIAQEEPAVPFELLESVKNLRNAASHGNCLLAKTTSVAHQEGDACQLSEEMPELFPTPSPLQQLSTSETTYLSPILLHDFCALLYCHRSFVSSQRMRAHSFEELGVLATRIDEAKQLLQKEPAEDSQFRREISSTLGFLLLTIDHFIKGN